MGATPFSDGKNRFVVLQDNGIGGFLYGLALEKLNTGDFVEYGQALGGQGGVGPKGPKEYGIHVHMALSPDHYPGCIRDLFDGVFDGKATTPRKQ
ncbi:MAG: hypothetical protein ACK541_08090 [Burkholderiales bacterium]